MLYICIFSNKFDLKQTIRVLHTRIKNAKSIKAEKRDFLTIFVIPFITRNKLECLFLLTNIFTCPKIIPRMSVPGIGNNFKVMITSAKSCIVHTQVKNNTERNLKAFNLLCDQKTEILSKETHPQRLDLGASGLNCSINYLGKMFHTTDPK